MSYFGKYYLTGPDAQAAADWVFTGDMRQAPGSTVYTCMLNEAAGIEADLTVSMLAPGSGSSVDPSFEGHGFYIATAGGSAYQNAAHIMKTIQDKGFNVELRDVSREAGLLSLQGPKSRQILEELTDTPLDNDSFPFGTHKMVTVAGHNVRAMRVSFVGELGWELHTPAESCVPVYQAIMKAGQSYGLLNAGYRAIDSLSIEKGYPHWHQEIRKAGIRKKKVCFTVDESVAIIGLEAILRDGKYVGHVRRGDHAFHLGKEVAYGYVANNGDVVTKEWLLSGDYQIESMGQTYPAKIYLKSPFDPKHKRIHGHYDPDDIRSFADTEAMGKLF